MFRHSRPIDRTSDHMLFNCRYLNFYEKEVSVMTESYPIFLTANSYPIIVFCNLLELCAILVFHVNGGRVCRSDSGNRLPKHTSK